MDSSSSVVVTLPADSAFEHVVDGARSLFARLGTGTVTFVPDDGVTLLSVGGADEITSQYGVATLIALGNDTWLLSGDIS